LPRSSAGPGPPGSNANAAAAQPGERGRDARVVVDGNATPTGLARCLRSRRLRARPDVSPANDKEKKKEKKEKKKSCHRRPLRFALAEPRSSANLEGGNRPPRVPHSLRLRGRMSKTSSRSEAGGGHQRHDAARTAPPALRRTAAAGTPAGRAATLVVVRLAAPSRTFTATVTPRFSFHRSRLPRCDDQPDRELRSRARPGA